MRILASFLVSMSTVATLGQSVFAVPTHADNSQANAGDLSRNAVTAQKQDNKHGDVKKLGKIRRHIVAARGLSMDAKNVKILVSKGEITLMGPVKDEAEKTRVEEIVKSCCPEAAVISQITVNNK